MTLLAPLPARAAKIRVLRAIAVLAVCLAGLTCRDRSLTGPGIPVRAALSVSPVFRTVPDGGPTIRLARMRTWIHVFGGGPDTLVQVVNFDGDSAVHVFDVTFTGPSQLYQVHLAGIDAAGDTLFRGLDTVRAFPNTPSDVRSLPLSYSGADAGVTDIAVLPADTVLDAPDSLQLTTTVLAMTGDSAPPALRVGWKSRDTAAAQVSASGVVRPRSIQRDVWIVARTATGVADSALVRVRAPVTTVVMGRDTASVARGSTLQLTAEARDSIGTVLSGRVITWSSNNANVSVDTTGLVSGLVARTTALVIATSGGKSDTTLVSVLPKPAASVVASPDTVTLIVGATLAATAQVLDAQGASNPDWTAVWSTSDASRATVSASGLITAVAAGQAVIRASADGRQDSVMVTVVLVPVATVAITPRSDTLVAGDAVQLTATARDSANTVLAGRAFVWASLTPALASVDGSGLVTTGRGVGGLALITATSEGKSDTASILVQPSVQTVLVSPDSAAILVGDSIQYAATAYDTLGGVIIGRPITWSTASASIASVSATGMVRGLAGGRTSVIATIGGKVDSAIVRVDTLIVPVATIAITPKNDTIVSGGTVQLTATTRDASNAVLTGRAVAWTSLNPGLASVSATGLVTTTGALGGVAQITATSEGKSDTATVVALRSVYSVLVSPDSATMLLGDSVQYSVTAYDTIGGVITGRPATWSVVDTAVASVSPTGVARGKIAGRTTVMATVEGKSDGAILQVNAGAGISSTVVSPKLDTLKSLSDTVVLAAQAFNGVTPVVGSFTWVSRAPGIVTVSATGQAVAIANGSAYVVATESGGTRDSALVVVAQRVSTVSVSPPGATRYLGTQQQFTASAVDGRGNPVTFATFRWSSTAPAIATVDTATGLAQTLSLGAANIQATAGGITGQATLNVITAITRIAVTPDSVTLPSLGVTQSYTAVAYDTLNVAMSGISFTWLSTNPSVAPLSGTTATTTVATSSANGLTRIRASAQGVNGEALLTVQQVLASIEATPVTSTIAPTGRVVLTARGKDANNRYTTGGTFTWSTDNAGIATVDASGTVTGVAIGIANITAARGAVTSNNAAVTVQNTVPAVVTFGRDTIPLGRSSSTSIPIYLSTPSASAVVIQLAAADTFAYFPKAQDTIPAGVTTKNVTIATRNAGTTRVFVTEVTGAYTPDTAVATVQANVSFSTTYMSMVATDNQAAQVLLSDPAPAGGVYVTYQYGTGGIAQISPDPAFVPAGQLAADIVVRGVGAGSTVITPVASGVSGANTLTVNVSAAVLTFAYGPGMLGAGQYQPNMNYIYTPAALQQPVTITFTSSDTTIARPLQAALTIPAGQNYVYMSARGLTPGSATITATAPGWTTATTSIRVTVPRLLLYGGQTLTTTSPPTRLTIYAADTNSTAHYRSASLLVSLVSTDTTVIKVDSVATIAVDSYYENNVYARVVGGGTAWVRATAGGHMPDSTLFTVNAPLMTIAYGGNVIGAGQYQTSANYIYIPNPLTTPLTVTFTARDSTIGKPTPTVIIPSGSTYAYFDIFGYRADTTSYTASAPGYASVTQLIRVTTPRVSGAGGGTRPMYTAPSAITVYSQDSLYSVRNRQTPLTVSLRSGDTTVFTIDSSAVTIGTGTYYNNLAKMSFVGVGTAKLYVTAPGHFSDSSQVITVDSASILSAYGANFVIGAKQTQVNGNYIYIPNARGTPVVVTVTQKYPAYASLPATLTIDAASNYQYMSWTGLAQGRDTITFSAPGYRSATIFLSVSRRLLRGVGIPVNLNTTSPPFNVYAYTTDTVGTGHTVSDTAVVRLRSSNTSVIQVDSGYVHIFKNAFYSTNSAVRVVGAGTARIFYEDSAGVMPPDSSGLVTVTGPALRMAYASATTGMRQRATNVNYVYYDNALTTPVTVNLVSSDPTVATVPATVTVPANSNYAYFSITGGDTIGTVAITATATGYSPVSMTVAVGKPRFQIYTSATGTTTTPPGTITIYAVDQTGAARNVIEPVTVTLASSQPGVAAPDSVTVQIPVDQYYSNSARMKYLSVGSANLTTADSRTNYFAYLPDTAAVTVSLPKINSAYGTQNLGIGQLYTDYIYIPNALPDTLFVTVTHNSAKSTIPPTLKIPPGQTYLYYSPVGVAAGTDTVTFSAPGHASGTTNINVDKGKTSLSGIPATLRVGDSVGVYLYTLDQATAGRAVAAATTFTLVNNGLAEFRDTTGPITSMTVAANSANSPLFYLRGLVAGTATVSVTHADYTMTTYSFTVSP